MRLASFAVAALVLLCGSASAATGDRLTITGNGVNLRAGPGLDQEVRTKLYRGQGVFELERSGEWVRVRIDNAGRGEGWIFGSLLAPAAGAAAPATGPQPMMVEPAAAPVEADLLGLAQFRESVSYLNSRAVAVAGVDLFTEVEPLGAGTVQVATTAAWSTVPPAGQESYVNTLVDRWAAARGGERPARVQIVDPSGQVVMERTRR